MIKKLDWNTYHQYIDMLYDKIEEDTDSHEYRYIAGVDSDDAIVAVHLSHKLNIPVISNMDLLSFIKNITDTTDVLVVSNVVETGKKFKMIASQIGSGFDTAALFVDKKALWKPTYYVEIPKTYIYFPWQQCGIDVTE